MLVHLLRSDQYHIYGLAHAYKVPVNISSKAALTEFATLYDKQVHVAVSPHVASCGRAEEYDLVRTSDLHNAADDFL